LWAGVEYALGASASAEIWATRLSGPRKPSSGFLPWFASSLLSISNGVRPAVAGCLGNGSMSGEEAH
jgi:hypothetical protein